MHTLLHHSSLLRKITLQKIPYLAKFSPDQIQVQLLNRSMNNTSYILSLPKETLVLKIPSEKTTKATLFDRRVQSETLKLVSSLNIYPSVIHFDVTTGMELRKYIEGRALKPAEITPSVIKRQVAILKTLHTASSTFANPIDLYGEFASSFNTIEKQNNPQKPDLSLFFELTFKILDRLAPELEPTVLCHSDPHPGNFLHSDERLYLLDWEYAGNSTPNWDLAFLATSTNFSEDEDKFLLDTYYNKSQIQSNAHLFFALKPLSEFIITVKMCAHLNKKPNTSLLRRIEQSLYKTEQIFNQPSVAQAIRQLGVLSSLKP